MSAKRFTLMGYGMESSWPTVRSVDTTEPTAVIEAAKAMLVECPQCDRIEVWSGSERLHTQRRPE